LRALLLLLLLLHALLLPVCCHLQDPLKSPTVSRWNAEGWQLLLLLLLQLQRLQQLLLLLLLLLLLGRCRFQQVEEAPSASLSHLCS
jgi:hypothetical protein